MYEHERTRGAEVWLTQPTDGAMIRLSYGEAMKEARAMAAHLRSLELLPGSHIVIFAKNNAWWFLADLAIWMAGHVSIPLYPVLPTDSCTPETSGASTSVDGSRSPAG